MQPWQHCLQAAKWFQDVEMTYMIEEHLLHQLLPDTPCDVFEVRTLCGLHMFSFLWSAFAHVHQHPPSFTQRPR